MHCTLRGNGVLCEWKSFNMVVTSAINYKPEVYNYDDMLDNENYYAPLKDLAADGL
jgi:hypothetical protein